MDIRDILKSFDQLSEATTTTDKGTVHKSEPGGYGNKHGSEDVKDQYGKPVGRMSLGKLGAQNEPKRGKGRPPNPDKAKEYDSTALNKAMGIGKAPKPSGKPSVKHSLKEYFDQMDEALSEAGLAVQPMPATPQQKQQQQMATKPSFMIKDPANPSMPAITTQDPAVVQAAKNGTMSMQKPGAAPTGQPAPGAAPAAGAGSQVAPMKETGDNWIKDATKNKGAFTAKAKSHDMTPAQFRAKVLAHKEDYPAKTEKQAQLAKTLSKMHESQGESPYTLELISSEEQDDPEGWSTMNVSTFKVLKNGKEIGTAEYDDYFGNLDIDINGKRQQLKYDSNHPLLKMAKHAVEEPTNIAQHGVKEAEAPQHFAQSSPLSTANRGVLESKKGVNPFAKKDTKKKPDENNNNIPDYAEDGKGKNDLKKKGEAPKKGVNPFAKKDEKKKVKEGMEHHLQAARLEGKSHALRKMPYNCTHDDMEEARCYHDGFKEGLDECYGQMPILGRTAVDEVSPEVGTMASYGAHDEMDEGNAFTAGLAKTPHGGKFKVGGSSFTDNSNYDSRLEEFAFEALDKQLNALLEGKDVTEGMTVSISKGQQGSPDSVSVSAQDGEADQLLSIIKSAGMGLFGGDEQNGYGAPQGSTQAPGGIEVVDDHDGMMALMRKLSGGGDMPSGGDYESEEGHGEEGHSHEGEEPCNECGMMECGCEPSGDQQVVDEVESEDQMAYNVAEDNPPDNGSANSTNATQGNDAANSALATADAGADEEEGETYSSPSEGKEDTTGEEAGKEELDEGTCKKCDCNPCKCETMSESSFFNLFRKISMLSEESTEKKDEKAEKAGKKVANDIEYDEGHKGKDDNKAEKAGKKVTKDIEYDDKKDEKYKKDKKVDESYANSADDTFEADIDFMTKVISGGLNKQKSTGQTTIPVINGQKSRMGVDGLGSPMKESNDLLKDYRKLSGL
jgi:hypothetical protein